jgi:hypothetical protein
MADGINRLKEEALALSPQDRAALAEELAKGLGTKLSPRENAEVGHFDLLFTVLYAAIVIDIFHTIAKSPVLSFQFCLSVTLLIVVIDHWLMHFRNREQIDLHRYFSLVTIGLTLFFYAKADEVLSATNAPGEQSGSWFWIWIILMFCTSFVMKRHYPDRWFHRIWDFVAVGACLIYITGIHCWHWTNNLALGLISLSLAVVYLPFEIHHYAPKRNGS